MFRRLAPSAQLETDKPNHEPDTWETTRPLLESLTVEKLTTAAQQAAKHKPVSDAAVKKLLAMVNTIGTKDPGSQERKSHLLAQLKSATVYYGLPQIFITLNPADNISPVALFYAGERIDVKSFYPRLYTAGDRLKTMLDNPLAVVEYFRNTINTIIKTMLKGGMFGDLIHYHGLRADHILPQVRDVLEKNLSTGGKGSSLTMRACRGCPTT
jgi:hypothetical protein